MLKIQELGYKKVTAPKCSSIHGKFDQLTAHTEWNAYNEVLTNFRVFSDERKGRRIAFIHLTPGPSL